MATVSFWHAGRTLDGQRPAALNRLADTVGVYYATLAAGASHGSDTARDWIEQRLRHGFRAHPQQAAAAFYYLALTALTLEQLRGLLLRLSLFPTRPEQTP